MLMPLKPAIQETTAASQPRGAVASLLPIMAVVALSFLIIGFVLPVLPLYVHLELGFGAFMVGLVTGSQFLAAVLSRERVMSRIALDQNVPSWAGCLRRLPPAGSVFFRWP